MGSFLEEELRNFSSKGMLGILGDGDRDTAPSNLAWYEELTTIDTITKPSKVWNDIGSIPPAKDQSTANLNVSANPSIMSAHVGVAVQCTPSPNGRLFFATSSFGDLSTRLDNWIMPHIIPRTDVGFEGFPSIGYAVRLWNGDPNSGGTEIPTTIDQEGSVPGWMFLYGPGVIKVSADFTGIVDPNDVWITGYRYIGPTGGSGGGSGSGITQSQLNISSGNTNQIQSIGLSTTRGAKWLINMERLGGTPLSMNVEFSAAHNGTALRGTPVEYALTGDVIDADIEAQISGSNLVVNVTNNEASTIVVRSAKLVQFET